MVRRVKLHVGFHKTGTTSFQGTCFRNRELLNSRQVDYPIFSNYAHNHLANHSIPIYSLFSSEPENYHINKRFGLNAQKVNEGYHSELERALSSSFETMILSGEDISILRENELRGFKDFLAARCEQIEVIALIRAPYSFAVSSMQQQIKGGSRAMESFIYRDARQSVRNLRAVFGRDICFLPFEKARQHQYGIVGTLLECMGLPDDLIASVRQVRLNKAASNEAVRLISAINARYPLVTAQGPGERRYQGDIDLLWNLPGVPFQVSLHELSASREKLDRECCWLSANLGLDFVDSPDAKGVTDKSLDTIGWGADSLTALENIAPSLEPHLLDVVIDYLEELAGKIGLIDEKKSARISRSASRLGVNRKLH
jgi:hypothetical protein